VTSGILDSARRIADRGDDAAQMRGGVARSERSRSLHLQCERRLAGLLEQEPFSRDRRVCGTHGDVSFRD